MSITNVKSRRTVGYVRAVPKELEGHCLWEVYCIDCNESIGTMHPVTLQTAILHNLGRGGVKCPECRSASCDGCGDNGLLSRGRKYRMYRVKGLKGVYRLCPICIMEFMDDGRSVEWFDNTG
jgi:hypothetical protein